MDLLDTTHVVGKSEKLAPEVEFVDESEFIRRYRRKVVRMFVAISVACKQVVDKIRSY